MIGRALDELVAATRFLTIVPVGERAAGGFGAGAFPVVGLGFGILAVVVDGLFGFAGSPLVDLAIVAAWMIASGAIHYDGLADSCDGLGGRTIEDRLRLMAEGSIGTFGVLGILVSFSLKMASLFLLVDGRATALVVAPTLARAAMLGAAFDMPSARPGGLGAAFVDAVDSIALLQACAIAVAVALVLGGATGLAAAVGVGLTTLGIRVLASRRLGGTTGDVIGATGEATEAIALAVFSIGAAW